MQSTNLPAKYLVPFATNDSAKVEVPVTTATVGRASQSLGFPPITGQPPEAGGVPPQLEDFNGAINQIARVAWWAQLGGRWVYDNSFATDPNIGGYPKGAVLMASTLDRAWINNVENNTTNPDSGGAGWTQWPARGQQFLTGSGTFTVPLGVYTIYATVQAAGGGGGGSCGTSTTSQTGFSATGGGGSNGQSTYEQAISVTPGQVISYSVGTGGTGGTSGGPGIVGTSGNPGGNTTFGTITCIGGNGGGGGTTFNTAGAGNGGAAATGGTGAGGVKGGPGSQSGAGGGQGGQGAGNRFGAGGGGGQPIATTNIALAVGGNGFAGGGGGGGGSTQVTNVGGATGGVGGDGFILVKW